MAEEEEPKKKSNIITILIFVVAGFVLVAVGLGIGFMVFGGSQGNPQDIANEIVMQKEGEKEEEEPEFPCKQDADGNDIIDEETGECVPDRGPEKIAKETPKQEVFQTLYYEIPGSMTTNLKGSRRFLQIEIGVSTKYDQEILDNVENHLTSLKADILAALSDYTEEMVEGRESRKLLANDLRDVINMKLEELEGFGGIEEVHLTSYVMQ